ncbi:hypothetical protein P171DRAFT_434698 [Karstenula rhodostoma CBS 690.94]|uniref:Uncharacterized protein n=1 Tax=Karstenula rhodostoma CBS 690.94 TaxID=1392251 RepID=A0A9P4PBM2_9PLEO|nr:hypothetical protein P171DRAFT_434698 [Karstenula rhodostoma CBS 690.94]
MLSAAVKTQYNPSIYPQPTTHPLHVHQNPIIPPPAHLPHAHTSPVTQNSLPLPTPPSHSVPLKPSAHQTPPSLASYPPTLSTLYHAPTLPVTAQHNISFPFHASHDSGA